MATINSISNSIYNNSFTVTDKTAGATASNINIQKDRSGGVITTADALGQILFQGHDGASYFTSASITSTSSGTIAAGRIASNLVFSTSNDAATPAVIRMTLEPSANITMQNTLTMRSGLTAADTFVLGAYDVDGVVNKGFITFTSNNTPTCDLDTAVTIGSAYIYRASGTDVAVADGGTGGSSHTQNGVLYGNAANAIGATAEGGTGTVLIGTTASAPSWLAASTDGKVLTAHTGAAPTWETPSGPALTWTEETGATAALAADTGWIMYRATAITATLPASCAVYKTIKIVGKGAGLTIIAQRANQMIHYCNITTTTGVGGSLTATDQWGCIELVCTVADLEFTVVSSTSNWTYV